MAMEIPEILEASRNVMFSFASFEKNKAFKLDTVVTRFSSKWPNSEYGQPPEKSQRFSHNVSQSVANV